MRAIIRAASVLIIAVVAAAMMVEAAPQSPPQATPQPGPFVGRWQVSLRPPAGSSAAKLPDEIPFAIVDVTGAGSAITGKLIDSMGAPEMAMTLSGVAVKGDQLEFTLDLAGRKVIFTGKRVDDHIEGTASANNDPAPWIGRLTTSDKLPDLMSLIAAADANHAADEKAYALALNVTNATDRETAFKKFLADYPNSSLKDSATLQIALAKSPPYKAAAIQYFIDTAPPGSLREQAEYELTRTMPAGRERFAAEEMFILDYPKSAYRATIYQAWFDGALGPKNVDEGRLTSAIDGMLDASPDRSLPTGEYSTSLRSSTLNNIADRLMANDVMLDRALALIQEAVKLDGDKAVPATLAIHTTTLGQVLFKLKRYDEAGDALKRAVQISGGDGDGETQLFLGKFYEVKKQDDLALAAYLKATEMGSPLDTKASLEKLYVKRYGSLESLDKKLDDAYREKGTGFDPGHYIRPATTGPARVVLAELFTGAECGPCVSADLAFDGIGERYATSDIATLVYHLHIPRPDPMTNADTVARAKYYAANATPTVVFDGIAKSSGGGDRSVAPESFGGYTNVIEKRLSMAPLASLDSFKAQMNGASITVTGEARLLPAGADRAGHVTLHVALAESDVRYIGSNGVRFHNLVVRKLLDGAQGTTLEAAKPDAPVSLAVDLTSLTASLDDYLTTYEKAQRSSFKFKERPTALDPSKLVVVAFVQDDKTKEVLQAVVITPAR